MTEPRPSFSLSYARVLMLVLPVFLIALVAYWQSSQWEAVARTEMANHVFARMLGPKSAFEESTMSFPDSDGDQIADPPADPAQWLDPEVIKFSYVASEEVSVPADAWDELLSALSKRLGKPVEYVQFDTTDAQLTALGKGELHIAGMNTGAVPAAVKKFGFVPVCTLGREDGTFGCVMKFLVPANSPIQTPHDLRGRKVTFTRPDSNSGCKAPLLLLKDEFGLLPERDYGWGFSMGHDESILGVAANKLDAAPVASDMLERAIANGDVEAVAIRSIYESERFPPAAIGYVYNLAPELRDAIRETLLGFDWNGTKLQETFASAAETFVPVNYKDDWANIRRIDQGLNQARQGLR